MVQNACSTVRLRTDIWEWGESGDSQARNGDVVEENVHKCTPHQGLASGVVKEMQVQ
jgi:hypothetical protein